ncbi:MAG: hypothetical protein U0168_06455 [Nannocystaceae bacterium]
MTAPAATGDACPEVATHEPAALHPRAHPRAFHRGRLRRRRRAAALEPVRDCHSDDECVAADDRFDRCQWVCEAHVTYCQPSCEVDADCRGRGLPEDYVFCDVPRPGEGFCNAYGYGYKPDACVQEVPPLPGHDGSG